MVEVVEGKLEGDTLKIAINVKHRCSADFIIFDFTISEIRKTPIDIIKGRLGVETKSKIHSR